MVNGNHIPFAVLNDIPPSKVWPKEKTARLIVDWNACVPIQKTAKRLGVSEKMAQAKIAIIQEIAKEKKRVIGWILGEEEDNRGGMRKCITCKNKFKSPDIRRIQICNHCKSGRRNPESPEGIEDESFFDI